MPLVIANKPYWLLSIGGVLRKQGAKHDENEVCHRCHCRLGRYVHARGDTLTLMSLAVTHKPRLRREIVVTLLVKFAVIYALWYLFFSEPVDENLEAPQVGDTLFGSAPVTSPSAAHSAINPDFNSVKTPKEK